MLHYQISKVILAHIPGIGKILLHSLPFENHHNSCDIEVTEDCRSMNPDLDIPFCHWMKMKFSALMMEGMDAQQ